MDEVDRSGELPRDMNQTTFTPILRRLWRISPAVLGVCFVDFDGECIDYCSSIDPFAAKVTGAHLRVIVVEVADSMRKLGLGRTESLHIIGDERELIAMRVSDECTLVLILSTGGAVRTVAEELARTVHELRVEARIEASVVGALPGTDAFTVETRAAKGWPYAPSAIVEGGARNSIAAVLGRWTEGGMPTGGELVCFRVRTSTGEELTLAHDVAADAWMRR